MLSGVLLTALLLPPAAFGDAAVAAAAKGHAGHGAGGQPAGAKAHAMKLPRIFEASPPELRQAETLRTRVWRTAAARFPTYRSARRLGYERLRRDWRRPVIFHVRRRSYDHDGRLAPRSHAAPTAGRLRATGGAETQRLG